MRQGRFQAPTLAVGARPWLQAPVPAAPSICSEQTDVRQKQRGLSKAYCTERPLRADGPEALSICSEQTDVALKREQCGLPRAYCTERPLRAAETLTAPCMHEANRRGRM